MSRWRAILVKLLDDCKINASAPAKPCLAAQDSHPAHAAFTYAPTHRITLSTPTDPRNNWRLDRRAHRSRRASFVRTHWLPLGTCGFRCLAAFRSSGAHLITASVPACEFWILSACGRTLMPRSTACSAPHASLLAPFAVHPNKGPTHQ